MSNRVDVTDDLIPPEVGRIALALHLQRSEELALVDDVVLKLDSDTQKPPLWKVKGNRLEFLSLAARNQCAARQFYRTNVDLSASISAKKVFEFAHELWRHEIGRSDSSAGRFVALLDNRIKFLEAAARLISSGDLEVFQVLHIVGAALRHLSVITVDELCTLVTVQHPRTKRDLAQGMLFMAIEDVLVTRPELAWKLHQYLTSAITDETLSLATSTLLALARAGNLENVVNQCLNDAESGNERLTQAAFWTIGRLMHTHDLAVDATAKCIDVLREGLQHQTADVRRVAMTSIELGARRHRELSDDLLRFGKSREKDALAIVAQHVFMNTDAIGQDERLRDFLEVLSYVPPDLEQCLEHIDYAVSQLWKNDDNTEALLDFLKSWILRNSGQKIRDHETIERFDQTISAICERPDVLQRVITEWLTADEPRLAWACSELISFLWVRGIRELSFSKVILDNMDEPAIIHLVRRMLGFVYSEEPLLSLTLSMLESRDAPVRTYPVVSTLLTKDIGRNFVEGTLQAIERRKDSAPDSLRILFESVRKELMAYQRALDELPVLQELRGPLQLRRAVALRKATEMRKSMDAANAQSVLLQFVKQIPIKAGIGCFSIRDGKVGETNRFGAVSHSVALPRRAVSDPVGYAIDGLLYRLSTRSAE